PAGTELEDALAVVGPCDVVDNLLDGDGGQRRPGRWLPYHRIAADGRDHGVPGPDRGREVERRDDADRAQWVPLLHHSMTGPLAGDRQAVELARQSDREVAHVDHLLDLALALAADLPGLEGDEESQVGLPGAEGLADLPDHLTATRSRHHPPVPERLARPADDEIVLIRRTRLHVRERVPVRRVHRAKDRRRREDRRIRWRDAAIELRELQAIEQVLEHLNVSSSRCAARYARRTSREG